MRKTVLLTVLIGLMGVSMAMAGCPAGCGCAGCAAKAEKQIVTCKGCGEVKASEKCCKPAAKCSACGLHKGSPGCAAACKKAK